MKGAKGEKSFAARLLSSNIVLDLQFNLDTSLPLQIVHLLAPRASPLVETRTHEHKARRDEAHSNLNEKKSERAAKWQTNAPITHHIH